MTNRNFPHKSPYLCTGTDFSGQTIIVADDDPIARTVLCNYFLKRNMHVLAAENGQEILRLIDQNSQTVSVVLFDWALPDMSGTELLHSIRNRPDVMDVFCIMIIAKEYAANITEGLEAGADEFITKPYEKTEVWMKTICGLRMRSLILNNLETDRLLQKLSLKDSQTGLINRQAFDSIIETETARCLRFSVPMCVMTLKILHYGDIYAKFGSIPAENAVAAIASILKVQMRKMDTVARLGQDLFGVLLPETKYEVCRSIMERIMKACSSAIVKLEDQEITIPVCGGITGGIPADPGESSWFLRLAFESLEEAQSQGMNQWVCRPFRLIRGE